MKSATGRLAVRIVAVVLCAAAVWVTLHLSIKHVHIAHEQDMMQANGAATTRPASQPASQPAESESLLDRICSAASINTSCEDVLKSDSAYIKLPAGQPGKQIKIPAAWLGLMYFTAMFWWLAMIGPVSRSRGWLHLVVACVAALGLGMSVWFVIQMVRMEMLCPLCLASHIINLLLFICVLLLWPRTSSPVAATAAGEGPFVPALAENATPESAWPNGLMVLATAVVIVLSIVVEQQYLTSMRESLRSAPAAIKAKLEQTEKAKDWYAKAYGRYETKWQHAYTGWVIAPATPIRTEDAPARTFALHNGRASFGYEPEPSRHTVVIFSDFQCPVCREFEKWLPRGVLPTAAQNGGITIVFKQWPICRDCNPDAERSIHPMACRAALASEAAFILGGNQAFWQMHDMLFEKQEEWSHIGPSRAEKLFTQYATDIGLDAAQFVKAMNGDEAMRRIKADIAEGTKLGSDLTDSQATKEDREYLKVDSTPSVYIDQKKLFPWRHFKAWQQIIAQPAPAATQPASRPAGMAAGH